LDARVGAGEPQRALGLQQFASVDGAPARSLLVVRNGEKVRDRHAEDLGDALQAAGRDAIGALLVFLHLLERDADQVAELGLRQAALQAQRAHALADLGIAGVSASSCHEGHRGSVGRPAAGETANSTPPRAGGVELNALTIRGKPARPYEL